MPGKWKNCKKILCIRADNMGDVIMSAPAMRALKESFGCSITLLTSKMGAGITPYLPDVDETIVADLPWVKTDSYVLPVEMRELIDRLRKRNFDAAVVFTVYSQNPLPSAMLAYMAGIPRRLAYCRENPYQLLTDWVPDQEPYTFIKHQVERDLSLVAHVGAFASDTGLKLDRIPAFPAEKLLEAGFISDSGYIVLHPGVSESRREFPVQLWVKAAKLLMKRTGKPVLITGSGSDMAVCARISKGIGEGCCMAAGKLSIGEFISVIASAALVISVNTGTVHIAAATGVPLLVLYARTNPQHTPWQTNASVVYYSVQDKSPSRNEVVRYVAGRYMAEHIPYPSPQELADKACQLLAGITEPG